ncbi:NAD(P)-binding domain-containing protein [Mycolicibacterium hodleri]|uniref:Pyridine nucleotide-disulfide oxidoreductase n=1 Tax=Mycolicibacterium hodleri TaxID=49897 RepID=A0A502DYR2_9MYCO|nr:NAD(P)-binding domain-containing protein [Mycolicibacterium hodleri]TPG29582.1 pyridine nucleotide-disulfide oxidoreductase [Mycolicibacterium hodleri]
MLKTTALVVGAGHSGLAMSRCLADRSIDHVVLERGEVADSWRTMRWDSMRLLTPNWMARLPGHSYRGDDPDGYLAASEVVHFIERYAKETAAPVRANTTVTSVRQTDSGFVVQTDQDAWHARSVVLASGANAVANVPALQSGVPAGITSLTPADYRNPDEVPDGGVLVVGASASGIQIAAELHRAGRDVTVAVGEHVRMPRTYRGKDILWWMDAAGLFDERYDQTPDLVRSRRLPSMQLVGSSERVTIDLNSLIGLGIQLVGRLAGIRDGIAQFSGSLPNMFALADQKLGRLLDTIDAWAFTTGFDGGDPPRRFAPTAVPATVPLTMDLNSGAIRTIIWATGFRPDMSWLDVPVFDQKGQIRHDGGATATPGLYLMGMPFMRRRKSSFIDGAAADAADLSGHLAHYLDAN